jgi:hypothetical protein
MALRLILLKKLHHGETVSLTALSRHVGLFQPPSRMASVAELEAMGLSRSEFTFLKAVFQSEPAFLHYLRHPFIISTLRRIGVADTDPMTVAADLTANYDRFGCQGTDSGAGRPVTVAIVAGMNPMFDLRPDTGKIAPSSAYQTMVEQLKDRIRTRLATDTTAPLATERLAFFTPGRPVTIHPGNADRVIDQLCPSAGFTLIVMGKNVYRTVVIDPLEDVYPHKRWIYLDTDDIQYDQVDAVIDTVVTAIRPILLAAVRLPAS